MQLIVRQGRTRSPRLVRILRPSPWRLPSPPRAGPRATKNERPIVLPVEQRGPRRTFPVTRSEPHHWAKIRVPFNRYNNNKWRRIFCSSLFDGFREVSPDARRVKLVWRVGVRRVMWNNELSALPPIIKCVSCAFLARSRNRTRCVRTAIRCALCTTRGVRGRQRRRQQRFVLPLAGCGS